MQEGSALCSEFLVCYLRVIQETNCTLPTYRLLH